MVNWFETIRAYYRLGLYTGEQLGVFVAAGWITSEQAEQITSEIAA